MNFVDACGLILPPDELDQNILSIHSFVLIVEFPVQSLCIKGMVSKGLKSYERHKLTSGDCRVWNLLELFFPDGPKCASCVT